MRAIRILLGTPDLPSLSGRITFTPVCAGFWECSASVLSEPVTRSHVPPMPAEHSTLGVCPVCERAIPPTQLLIEYETADGTRIYAECPECRDVVHPE